MNRPSGRSVRRTESGVFHYLVLLRDDFQPESDIDVLIEFELNHKIGLIGFAGQEMDLSDLFGRKVDLNTPNSLSRYFRDEVLAEQEPIYVAPF